MSGESKEAHTFKKLVKNITSNNLKNTVKNVLAIPIKSVETLDDFALILFEQMCSHQRANQFKVLFQLYDKLQMICHKAEVITTLKARFFRRCQAEFEGAVNEERDYLIMRRSLMKTRAIQQAMLEKLQPDDVKEKLQEMVKVCDEQIQSLDQIRPSAERIQDKMIMIAVGELYIAGHLSGNLIHKIIQKLNKEGEENIEQLCALLPVVEKKMRSRDDTHRVLKSAIDHLKKVHDKKGNEITDEEKYAIYCLRTVLV